MIAWIIFCVVVALSFFVPGGFLFVLFWGLILTPLWLVLFILYAFILSLLDK